MLEKDLPFRLFLLDAISNESRKKKQSSGDDLSESTAEVVYISPSPVLVKELLHISVYVKRTQGQSGKDSSLPVIDSLTS